MKQDDFKTFTALLDATCSMLSRGNYTPNATSTALFFNALQSHSLETVKAAFSAHCQDPQRGRFAPLPADILAQITASLEADGRPDDAEAWATALRASDEASTVVWTEETAEAWGICLPVMQAGDKVGARMSFKSAYVRLVAEARDRREPIRWSVSEGHDLAGRDDVLRLAVEDGRLPVAYLPAPRGPIAGLLELSQQRGCPEEVRERLLEIRHQILSGSGESESVDFAEKQRTADLKAAAAELVKRASGGAHGV